MDNKVDTKAVILQIAEKLFNQNGFEKTSTRRIAKEANLAAGTMFNHFPSKVDLFLAIFEKNFKEMIVEIKKAVDKSHEKDDKIYIIIKMIYERCSKRMLLREDFMKVGYELHEKDKGQSANLFIERIFQELSRIFFDVVSKQYNIKINKDNEHLLKRLAVVTFAQTHILSERFEDDQEINCQFLSNLVKAYIEKNLLEANK